MGRIGPAFSLLLSLFFLGFPLLLGPASISLGDEGPPLNIIEEIEFGIPFQKLDLIDPETIAHLQTVARSLSPRVILAESPKDGRRHLIFGDVRRLASRHQQQDTESEKGLPQPPKTPPDGRFKGFSRR